MLLLTFFLQFFPDLIRRGHLYILQTPLFRVRKKKKDNSFTVYYCYSEAEKLKRIEELGSGAEVTRFKGLGEISDKEFEYFIGQDMRLDSIRLENDDPTHEMLEFYMGNNTPDRQNFIMENLREDVVLEERTTDDLSS